MGPSHTSVRLIYNGYNSQTKFYNMFLIKVNLFLTHKLSVLILLFF